MDALTSQPIEGAGTSGAEWLGWAGLAQLAPVTPAELVPPGCRAVVVAPHPDDEVLAVGGLLARLARLRRDLLLVAVTDGTASHAGSTAWPPERLARERPLESQAAWRRLGLKDARALRLGLPDGGLPGLQAALADRLETLLRPGDAVFTTWRLDGHPDHEATGHACAAAAARAGATLVEVPVWAWHWGRRRATALGPRPAAGAERDGRAAQAPRRGRVHQPAAAGRLDRRRSGPARHDGRARRVAVRSHVFMTFPLPDPATGPAAPAFTRVRRHAADRRVRRRAP